jgi:hypothetical protein
MNRETRELNVLQISRALGIPYGDIYYTIKLARSRIPVRKHRGRLLIPEDALPLLRRIHYDRKHPKIPNGWIKLIDFCRQHNLRYYKVIEWAKRLGMAQKLPPSNRYYIHEDKDKIDILLSICRTGKPPREWVRLYSVFRSRTLRSRVRKLLYLVDTLRVGMTIYVKKQDVEFLKSEVIRSGGNYSFPVKRNQARNLVSNLPY